MRQRSLVSDLFLEWGDGFFCNRQYWRRLRGGHWEQWHVDRFGVYQVWFPLPYCSRSPYDGSERFRPDHSCRGRPVCEEWE